MSVLAAVSDLPWGRTFVLHPFCFVCEFFVEDPGGFTEDDLTTTSPEVLISPPPVNLSNGSLLDHHAENTGGNKFYLPVRIKNGNKKVDISHLLCAIKLSITDQFESIYQKHLSKPAKLENCAHTNVDVSLHSTSLVTFANVSRCLVSLSCVSILQETTIKIGRAHV